MDKKNLMILHELDKNGRISYSKIGKTIQLSKNSVINRIKDMEKENIILGYNALINVNSLGYTTYDIYLKFKDTRAEDEERIVQKAIENKHIWLVAKIEGSVNLSLLISTKTPEEFDKIWQLFYQETKPYVEVQRIAILLEYHHFRRKYLADKKTDTVTIIAKRGTKEVDQTDEEILRILSNDARTPLTEIAKQAGLTTKAASYRIKRLEKEDIILGYSANLHFQKLGYAYYKLMITLNDLSIHDELYEYLKNNKNCVFYDKFIGGKDFEFDLEVESFEKFLTFINQLKERFGNAIHDYEYLNPTMIHKTNYFSH